MTVASLVPNVDIHVLPHAIWPSPGPTGSEALSDTSDGTWLLAYYEPQTVGLSTFVLPVGAVTKSVQLALRGATATSGVQGVMSATLQASGSTIVNYPVDFGWSPQSPTFTDLLTATTPVALDQSAVDGMTLVIAPIGTGQTNVVKATVLLVYAVAPVVVVSAPSGTVTTASPTATWSFVGDPDADFGGAQQRYRVKVFAAAQYDAAGFDPATAIPIYDSDVVISSSTSATLGPLANATALKAYVSAAQNVNGSPHWSPWIAGPVFATNTDPPVVASIVAASSTVAVGLSDVGTHDYLDTATGYVTTPNTADMAITGPVRLTIHQAIDALAPAAFPGSIAKSGATRELYMYAYEPNSWLATFETNGADDTPVGVMLAYGTPDGVPFTCGVEFAAGSTAATIIGTDGNRSPFTFPQAAKPTNIPVPLRLGDPGMTGRIYWAQLEHLDGSGNPAGIIWRFDAAEYPGTGTTWTDPRGREWTVSPPRALVADGAVRITVTRDTGHTDWTHVQIERSAGDRFSWEPIRGALEVVALNDVVVVHDYEQPDGVELWYRARGIIRSEGVVVSQGPWLATSTPIVWTPSDCGEYLRDPNDPFGAVLVEVLVDEATTTTEHRVGLIDVIGRASPVSVWDVPSLATGTLPIVTRTFADGTALHELVRSAPVLLWQGRRAWGHPHRWLVITNHTVSRYPSSDPVWTEYREWALDYVEVDPPPVLS